MSGWIPIDEWFEANEKARDHHVDKSDVVDRLYSEVQGRTCKTKGCNARVKGKTLYCEKCSVESKRRCQRNWSRKRAKEKTLAKLRGEEQS